MQQLNAAPSPERALFRAVIEQALRDACLEVSKHKTPAPNVKMKYHRKMKRQEILEARDDARKWLLNPNTDFQEICDLAGVRPELVRRVAEDLKANGWQGHNNWKYIL